MRNTFASRNQYYFNMNIYNLIILDESGSMAAIERQAISSMNETIQTIKAAQKKHKDQNQFITIISFSGYGMEGVKLIRDRVPADEVVEISEKDYMPDSCTPLYDAMGFGIISLDKAISKEDAVLVTIITDGMENTSQLYSSNAIAELVAAQRKKGWTFAYIGANQDSVEVANSMNINNAMNFFATEEGTMKMSAKLNHSRERLYAMMAGCKGSANDCTDFFEED